MQKLRGTYILFVVVILTSGCASSTLFRTTPEGSDIFINGEKTGITPYYYSDSKIAFSSTPITFKKTGYRDLNIILKRNERADGGAILGGIFCYVPFLWFMQYNPTHLYELEPINQDEQFNVKNAEPNDNIVLNPDSLYSKNNENIDTLSARSIQNAIINNRIDSLGNKSGSEQNSWSYKSKDFSTMNAEQLTHHLRSARITRNWGIALYVAGGLSITSALMVALGAAGSIIYDNQSDTDQAMNLASGLLICGTVGIVTGIPLAIVGAVRKRHIEVYLQNLKFKTNNSVAGGLGLILRF